MTQSPAGTQPAGTSKEALLNAAQAAVSDAREKAGRVRRGETRFKRIFLMVVSMVLFGGSVYVLAARPPWLFTPPPAAEPVALQDASARLLLAREAQRIRSYRTEHGRLPATLDEAGSPAREEDLTYDRLPDGTFVLRLPRMTGALEYRSTTPEDEFLGASLQVVMDRVGR